jgi:alkanesulfonate monooxygenase
VPVEIIGLVPTADASESRGGIADFNRIDPSYIARVAQAHDAGNFDRVLIGYSSSGPDGWSIAERVLDRTERLKVLIAHRPGFVQPTLAARKAATLDQLSGGGRVAIHIITGGNEAEQNRDGDFLDHDTRYRRSAEFISVFRRTLQSAQPFDFEGEFYQFKSAFSAVKPLTETGVPVFFGGSSVAAVEVGGRLADVYAVWGEPLDSLRAFFDQVLAVGAPVGHRPSFSVSLRPILADTEEDAWARADAIAAKTEERIAGGGGTKGFFAQGLTTSVGRERLLEHADKKDVHDERLWTKVAGLTRSGGNTTALVGTPQQVAEALLRYYDLGADRLLIRGFDPYEDAVEYGEKLIPLVREGVAKREEALVGV